MFAHTLLVVQHTRGLSSEKISPERFSVWLPIDLKFPVWSLLFTAIYSGV